MNKAILNTVVQSFINDNLCSDIPGLILKGIDFNEVLLNDVIEQIEAKNKAKNKLPTWFRTKKIYYPNKLNIEQTSSEEAANYKASLVSGDTLIDLTGGFGVDSFYFSKALNEVVHCEVNSSLSEIAKHNYTLLKAKNIQCYNTSGIDILKRLNKYYDWVYIDPSRRDMSNQKVFLLADCTPNVVTFQGLFLKYAKNVMIKTAPLIDISKTYKDLNSAKELHVVAIKNEVKELLWVLDRGYKGTLNIITTNIKKTKHQRFEFDYAAEAAAEVYYGLPSRYLYEPNAAILKSGAFKLVGAHFNIAKLHIHSHLYTSERLIDFPGRCFTINKYIPYSKKVFSKEQIKQANVTTRNFPIPVSKIRKELKLKDGGTTYLFFTTLDNSNKKVIIICSKVS